MRARAPTCKHSIGQPQNPGNHPVGAKAAETLSACPTREIPWHHGALAHLPYGASKARGSKGEAGRRPPRLFYRERPVATRVGRWRLRLGVNWSELLP